MNSLKAGAQLQNGKYKIERFINSGGFGCTYEGVHTMLDTKVAIKEFFVKDFCNRDEATSHITIGTESKRALVAKLRKKFVEEAKILFKELHHPGIVRVTDIFEENGTAYYVMDYIEGRSLNDIVKTQGKLSESDALRYIRQAGDALAYVHSQNMLHLDVKPGNIMIDSISDKAVLIDFGTSKQYDEVEGENTSTLMGKTPGFAPPEQMGNDVVKFTPATDIYSLGATLYKLLTGITPPSATQLISGEELEPMPKAVSENTRKAVEQAMLLNKNKRPQTVAEFLDILQQGGKQIATPKPQPVQESEATQLVAEVDTVYEDKQMINGHEYVDLGLSVKWATCNVGASQPHECGDYFAWGETETKEEYIDENCKTIECIKVKKGFFKKRIETEYIDKRENFKDTARVNWGGSWRLPTKREMEELEDKCTWKWTTQSGVDGMRVTGPNGNSIFLPAAGYCWEVENIEDLDSNGYYWSSTPYESIPYYAYYLDFDSNSDDYLDLDSGSHNVFGGLRDEGRTVRPVSE